ncbi:carbamoyltransferase C-terminal domain-containing protein [Caballeronia sp. LZ043]|uniref:carbamoyltransferase C-terminal domain-containing protein n=2 Tax=unclassified Caballeronia TaxID=2646786 RepID=UPI002865B616|nr:carbamoyltransferase C-terminal domain-containing protein [Caballeronia sp. LZ043]MDR5822803.1 carbamoyltransferase C-terminal domain-containing protein [Caballeronia sp. LZ043]
MIDHPFPCRHLSIKGSGCRIAVFDQAVRGEIRRLGQVADAGEHVRRITGFVADATLGGFASESEWLSVSAQDCFEHGYETVRARIEEAFGPVHIEVHAYSAPASCATARHERDIARASQRLMLCSPGHDTYRVRFPATSSAALTVGLLRGDGSLVGAGLGSLLKPALLISDRLFPALDTDGKIVGVRGTSPAVTFVAGIAALFYEKLEGNSNPSMLHAALLLLSSPHSGTYLLDRIEGVRQSISSIPIATGRGRERSVTLRLRRGEEALCRIAIVVHVTRAESLGEQHRFPVTIEARIGDEWVARSDDHRLLLQLDDLPVGAQRDITLRINGFIETGSLVSMGAQTEVISDVIVPVKAPGDTVVVGVSASHDASAVLALNGKLVAGIQLERITRVKHDGQSSLNNEAAIRYCLDMSGFAAGDVDLFAFNVQALTPGYVGLSQPLASRDFTLFDPFGHQSLFVSHHLCHALAGYSGSGVDAATVVVADGSGGVTVGADDLVLDGTQLRDYLDRDKGDDPLKLHTFSVYDIAAGVYRLRHREYARSFNVRSGSESLGETYAAVSQFVFNSWQASGKLMGLAPYGSTGTYGSFLRRDTTGELNFGHQWKTSVCPTPAGSGVMQYADLAARVQSDLEAALLDRFERHVGGNSNVVFTGGIALNSVANQRIHAALRPRSLYLLPAQHDAGVAIGAAAAAVQRLSGHLSNRLFRDDFLGYRYTERDVAIAINHFAERLDVQRVTPADIAERIANGAVFGYFSLNKGSEFGPRALGARSILADPRKRAVWNFINKWVKYREEFRPFAPMVAAEALSDYFDAKGHYPHMLEIVNVHEPFRSSLAGITHVDGSARVQTVCSDDNPDIHALLTAFADVTGFPILLNTSFNVRGQPLIEQPRHALEMLLSTQLSGVLFGDLLVEVADWPEPLSMMDRLVLSPGTRFELSAADDGAHSTLHARSQGRRLRLDIGTSRLLHAIASACRVGEAIAQAGAVNEDRHLDTLRRFVRLRLLNRVRGEVGGASS